ncbi:MAG: helix-hairpin-helix domain-containing protein [Candidatus Erginobacter occultus]|nr:helix-hairpin-helix domain-containing protein [Candidatus Erginobacter occultus]
MKLNLRILLAAVLIFCWVTAVVSAEVVDVNSAGPLELERLYRVTPRIARQIVAEREKNGHYLSLEDLAGRIREIGPQTIDRWEGLAIALP